ncbi:NAD(P)-dependent oxidoreductase [Streptomyces sp. NRRL B-24484]|uniref:NAD(P)-dependent oxidoreductase n=1 Tax=Streptomyces sp. NRRL B-24484 TaxID=1463833 RepID=UPI0004BEC10D|nr:NAD(P)H-binding protein [Streptomyces sp. NRRL B-24484]
MARIAVFGANGSIGRCIVTEALARGHRVTAAVRDPGRYQGLTPEVARGDVLAAEDVARVAEGQDALVSAVGGGDGPGTRRLVEPAARSLVAGLRALGSAAPRLIVVGGAGSLETAPGVRVWDTPGLPADVRQMMHAHGEALAFLRTVADLQWTVLSPAADLLPGERTGHYRTDTDRLVIDAEGRSAVSIPDFAVALVDEIEQPRHLGERFTCAH